MVRLAAQTRISLPDLLFQELYGRPLAQNAIVYGGSFPRCGGAQHSRSVPDGANSRVFPSEVPRRADRALSGTVRLGNLGQRKRPAARRSVPMPPSSARGLGLEAEGLASLYAVCCSAIPSSFIISSRMANFCTLPVTVIGYPSTKLM